MASTPLHALQVFVEVARRGGIRPAAESLNVTPGAVSRQIKALEEHLGRSLLERQPGSMARLTPDGEQLLHRSRGHMDGLQQILSLPATGRRPRAVVVNTSVTLAMHWLIPQLPRLQQHHPTLRVEVQTDDGPADRSLPVDVFLRRDPAELAGLRVEPFLTEYAALVASPSAWPADRPWSHAALRHITRIAARSRPDLWPAWCEHAGLNEATLPPAQAFDNTILAIQAVVQGLGVGVLPLPFVADMLTTKTLRQLPAAPVPTGSYAYAVRTGRESARVTAFTDWLKTTGRIARTTRP
jgi:LysR family glycine cleavage system transcriptional activator